MFNKISGVQRYTGELLHRMHEKLRPIQPNKQIPGFAGHLWEQITLPHLIEENAVLWSPSNTGPLSVSQQVVTIHDMAAFDFPDGFNLLFSTWYRFLLPRLMDKTRKIIAVSEFTKRQIVRHSNVDPEKISVIYNGVHKRYHPESLDKVNNVRKKIGVPSSKYILSLGSIEPRKNIKRLLMAWDLIQTQLPNDVWLVLAGVSGKSHIFPGLLLENLPPRVFLTGFVEDNDLPYLYSGAIATIYPSLYEGFGLPPLESMACGTPVIVSNSSSLPEVVGNAGILVNPYDIEDIASSIYRMISEPTLYEEFRYKGIEKAKRFSWDKTANQVWQVLQEAAE